MNAVGEDITISVPSWVDELARAQGDTFPTLEEQLRLTIELSRVNVERGGGPFGAAVFAGSTLVAAGVNCVLSSGLSIAHAEIVALMLAQTRLGANHGKPEGPYTLISSAEPCCQCFGALIWSGVDQLVYGASRADVEAIGFDEGPKPERWAEVLRGKGIEVVEELCRIEALGPLEAYAQRGGPIYGLRHPTVRG
jgi:tRNA(Arg) A34 adenosine deaminase TadA